MTMGLSKSALTQRPQTSHLEQVPKSFPLKPKQIEIKTERSARSVSAGHSTFRQQQNFDYKNELEFRFEQRQPRRRQDFDEYDLDDDPLGMLTSRLKQQKPQKLESTFGKDKLKDISHSFSSSSESESEIDGENKIDTHVYHAETGHKSSYQDAVLGNGLVFTTEGARKETKPEIVPRLTLAQLKINN